MSTKLFTDHLRIQDAFREEILDLGGTVTSEHDGNNTLFLRAQLPDCREVQAKDKIRHGVAARSGEEKIVVHPYTYREVCTNGAIHVENIASRIIDLSDRSKTSAETEFYFREAIRSCSSPEAFEMNLDDMKESLGRPIRMALAIASISHLGSQSSLMERIISRFIESEDRSGFDFANAITATARDEKEPRKKWELEELGGGVLALLANKSVQHDRNPFDLFAPDEPAEVDLLNAG